MMSLGAALQRWGIPAHRLEARMNDVAERVGLEAQFFSTPTSLMAGFGPLPTQSVRLLRIVPENVDLSKLIDLDRIADDVANGGVTPQEALRQVRAVDERRPHYRAWAVIVAFALVGGGACRLSGAGLTEILAASTAGIITGILSVALPRAPGTARLFDGLAALLVTLWVATLQGMGVDVSPFVVILSGLIVIVPGLTVTVAVSELATKNVVSGASRLTGAGMTLLQMGFGVALGQQVARLWLDGPLSAHPTVPLPAVTELLALMVVALSLTVLFQAPMSLLPAIALATGVALGGARLGTVFLEPEQSAFVGALLVVLMGNLYARWRNQPALVLIVPGLLVLVPGSLGFRSVNSLLEHNPDVGVATLFSMGMVAVSIVVGLLVANVVLPPRMGRESYTSL